MDFDSLLKQFQDWINEISLIILRGGVSAPFGSPCQLSLPHRW